MKISHIENGKVSGNTDHDTIVLDLDSGNVYQVVGFGNKPQLHLIAETQPHFARKLLSWVKGEVVDMLHDGSTVLDVKFFTSKALYIDQDFADQLVDAAIA